jgi:hypothetical protein
MIRFAYHAIAAFVLNMRAKYYAHQMRKGIKGSGWDLRDVGNRSNEHEKLRDQAKEEFFK